MEETCGGVGAAGEVVVRLKEDQSEAAGDAAWWWHWVQGRGRWQGVAVGSSVIMHVMQEGATLGEVHRHITANHTCVAPSASTQACTLGRLAPHLAKYWQKTLTWPMSARVLPQSSMGLHLYLDLCLMPDVGAGGRGPMRRPLHAFTSRSPSGRVSTGAGTCIESLSEVHFSTDVSMIGLSKSRTSMLLAMQAIAQVEECKRNAA